MCFASLNDRRRRRCCVLTEFPDGKVVKRQILTERGNKDDNE